MATTPVLWKEQTQINLTDVGDQTDPAVVSIGMGRYLVAWNESANGVVAPGNGKDIVGQIYDALGNPVGSEFQLNTAAVTGDQRDALLAARPDGGFVVAYTDFGSPGYAIHVETYDIDGNIVLGRPTTIANGVGATSVFVHNPGIAMAADGSYLITYQSSEMLGHDILGRIVDAQGKQGDPFTVRADTQLFFDKLSVDALSNGTFVVAYTTFDGQFDAHFSLVTLGNPPSSSEPRPITNDGGSGVRVAALKNGGFAAVYMEGPGESSDVRAAIFNNNGNVVKAAFTVNEQTDGKQHTPEVAALPDGGCVVVWDDDAADLIMGQRYDAAGNKIGSAFVAGNGMFENEPTVAVLDDGRLFVGFDHSAGDANEDVLGTIFDPRDEVVIGTDRDDVLTSLVTGAKVEGKGGDDHLIGVDAEDELIGGTGNDTLDGGAGDDTLDGGAGADIMRGGAGKDKLKGGGGKDVLVSGDGKDKLKGGGGKDQFVFAELGKSNGDKVKGFKPGKDKIVLLDDIFEEIGGKLSKKELVIGKQAEDGNDCIIVKEGRKTDKLFYDADGDGGGKQVLFAKVQADTTLTHKDLMIVDDFVI